MTLSKRERTRRDIAAHAYALYADQGYDNTTVAQIVKAAGVSHMTFFRNFPTRAHVVISSIDVPLLTRFIASAPLSFGSLECLSWTLLQFLKVVEDRSGEVVRNHLQIVASSEALGSEVFGPNSVLMNQISRALHGRGLDEWEARITAAAGLGAVGGAINRWYDYDADTDIMRFGETVVQVLVPEVSSREKIYRDFADEVI